jgi:hypothetical protein
MLVALVEHMLQVEQTQVVEAAEAVDIFLLAQMEMLHLLEFQEQVALAVMAVAVVAVAETVLAQVGAAVAQVVLALFTFITRS